MNLIILFLVSGFTINIEPIIIGVSIQTKKIISFLDYIL